MRIVNLKLRGMRCFERLDLDFSPGINLVSGPNGSGKTTLFDAIGFALFGVPPRRGDEPPAHAIRDGEQELRIDVTVAQSGRHLMVSRTLGCRSGESESVRLSDPANDQTLASEPNRVTAMLSELMNVADKSFLPLLYRRLVGICQGGLTHPFLLPPEGRGGHFAPLLNLDRYELAGRRAAAVTTLFTGRLSVADEDRARVEGELLGYRSALTQLDQSRRQRDDAVAVIEQSEEAVKRLASRIADHEEQRRHVESFRLELAVAEEGHRGRSSDETRCLAQLQEAQQAADIVDQTRSAYERFQELDGEIRAAELRRRELGDLRSEVLSLEGRLGQGRADLGAERDMLEAQLEANQQDTEELLALRDSRRGHIEALRARVRRAEGTRSALEMAKVRSEKLQELVRHIEPAALSAREDHDASRREREARRAETMARVAAEDSFAAEIADLRARAATLDPARGHLREIREGNSELERRQTELRTTLQLLQPAHGACPILREPCSNIGGTSLVERFGVLLDEANARTRAIEEELRIAESRVRDAESARQLAEERTQQRQREAGTPPRGADVRRTVPRPLAGSYSPVADFDEVGHHLSGLAGIIGAIEPNPTASERGPIALIGEVAGVGERHPMDATSVTLPELVDIEIAQRLVDEGRAALRADAGQERLRDLSARLSARLRQVHASIVRAQTDTARAYASYQDEARTGEATVNELRRQVDDLSIARARLRLAVKNLATRDLGLLDTELALSDRRVKLGGFERVEAQIGRLRTEQEGLRSAHESYQVNALLAQRCEVFREEWEGSRRAAQVADTRLQTIKAQLDQALEGFDPLLGQSLAQERDEAQRRLGDASASARALDREIQILTDRLKEFEGARAQLEEIAGRRRQIQSAQQVARDLETLYEGMAKPVGALVAETIVGEANRLYRTVSGRTSVLEWGEARGLILRERSGERSFAELAHGDQVTAALAIHLALLRQFPQIGLLCLDEPTAHLDESRRRALAQTLARFRDTAGDYVEQIVVVSHDDAFAHAADRHIRLG